MTTGKLKVEQEVSPLYAERWAYELWRREHRKKWESKRRKKRDLAAHRADRTRNAPHKRRRGRK